MITPRLLVLVLGLCALPLTAQDSHYWTEQFGARSALLGGAVIAGCDDTGAGFYNPGRLGFITNPQLSASASLYQIDILSIENGAGTNTKIDSLQARIVPLLASGIFLFEGAPGHAFGFNIIARNYWSASASARREATENVISDVRSPGDEFYSGQLDIHIDLQEYWAGLTYSCRFNRYLSFGVTHYGCLRLEELNSTTRTRAVGAPLTLFGSDNVVDLDYYNVRTLWKFGLAFDYGWLKAGITVTTPSMSLFGNGKVTRSSTIINLDLDGNGTGDSILADDRQEGLNSQFRSPWSFGLGVEYTAPTWTRIAFAMEWFLPVGEYSVITPKSKNFYVGLPIYADTRQELRVNDQRRGALNFAIGTQQKFNEWISGTFSFRTDFHVDTDIDSPGFEIGVTAWNLFHVSTGLIFTSQRHEFGAGIQLSIGSGQFRQPISFVNVTEAAGLVGRTHKVDQGYTSIALIVGYTYYF